MKKEVIIFIIILLIIIGVSIFYFSMREEVALDNSRCYLEPDSGTCKAYMPMYYFDLNEGICKQFIYGGCDGVVPFETMEECKITCE